MTAAAGYGDRWVQWLIPPWPHGAAPGVGPDAVANEAEPSAGTPLGWEKYR